MVLTKVPNLGQASTVRKKKIFKTDDQVQQTQSKKHKFNIKKLPISVYLSISLWASKNFLTFKLGWFRKLLNSIITLPQGFYRDIQEHLISHLFLLKLSPFLFPEQVSREFMAFHSSLLLGLLMIQTSLYAPIHHWMAIPTEMHYLTWPCALGATQTVLDRHGSCIQVLSFLSDFFQTTSKYSQFHIRHWHQRIL